MERGRLTTNTGLKIGSLTVALLLWFHIATEKDSYERTVEIPFQVVGITEGYVIADEVPTTWPVRFRGNGKRLLTLPLRDLAVRVDASEIRASGYLSLGVENVIYPEALNLEVLQVLPPEQILITVSRLEEVRLLVRTPSDIQTASGYTRVGEIVAIPDSVTLIGPERDLSRLSYVEIDTLRLRRVRDPVDMEVPVLLPLIYNTTVEPTIVRIVQDIQALGERVFEDIPITFIGTDRPERFLAEPRTASVTVQGGTRLLETLSREDVRLLLDMNRILPDGLTLVEPRIELPRGITLKLLEPPFFRVTEY
ncbi:YbbR-like domain-containing protein [Candidatus Zixiibacteriota bacterium]